MNLNIAAATQDEGVYFTPKAKILWPELFEPVLPKGEIDKDKARYQLTLVFHKTADLKLIQEAVLAVAQEKLGSKIKETKWRKPFLKVTQDDQPKVYSRLEKAGLDPADWPVMVRLASKIAPSVRAADRSKVDDETQVYEGRWARASVRPYFYDHPTGGKGVSLGLSNVQLLDNDDPLPRGGGGRGGDEFEAVSADGASGSADTLFDD